jgi:hypothetical protein
MSTNISKNSRLTFSDLLDTDQVEFWDLPNYPRIPTSAGDILYMVLVNDRLDLLAHKYYGDSNLWWVIAVANSLDCLPIDLVAGSQILIPSPQIALNKVMKDTGTN